MPPSWCGCTRHSFTRRWPGLIAAAVGVWLIRRRAAPGIAALAVLSVLAAERFGVEFLRLKDDRFLAGFTLAQLISVALLLAFALLALRLRGAAADR